MTQGDAAGWRQPLAPMTYMANGKQYIVVAVSAGFPGRARLLSTAARNANEKELKNASRTPRPTSMTSFERPDQ